MVNMKLFFSLLKKNIAYRRGFFMRKVPIKPEYAIKEMRAS
jgi:hypothetical protein